MALTREQYSEIMRIFSRRRSAAYQKQSMRQEEVEGQIPAIRVLNEKMAELSLAELEAGFGKSRPDRTDLRRQREELKEKKKKLLEDAGFGADYLEIAYTCPKCRDTGYVGNVKCGCFRLLESELLNRDAGLPALLDRENFSTFDPDIFDDVEVIEELLPGQITQYEYMTGTVMDSVRDFIDGFEDGGGQNILMMGPPGTGKTFLCNCIAKTLIDRQHTVIYERAGRMFEMFSSMYFSRNREEGAEERAEQIGNSELLIIDDLGTEFLTDYTRSKLFQIISNRLSAGLSSIISTNLSLNQLSSIYGERLTSRFIGEYILLPFYGSDLREKKRGGEIG